MDNKLNYEIKIINNITKKDNIPIHLPSFIFNTVKKSLLNNEANTYNKEELEYELSRKSTERVQREIQNKFFVYIEVDDNVAAFEAVSIKGNKFYYTWLQVLPEYQKNGFATIISNIRDEFVKSLNAKEVYIQSFKFPSTLRFHKRRGFKESGKTLQPTHIDMIKTL